MLGGTLTDGTPTARTTPLAAVGAAVWVGSVAGSAGAIGFVVGLVASLAARLGWTRMLRRRAANGWEEGAPTDV
jgi:O-antigen/teichoic acid export membrane protein